MRCSLLSFLRSFVGIVKAVYGNFLTINHLNWNTCYNGLNLRDGGSDSLLRGQGGWRERGQCDDSW